jgi:hypothetical protein
MSNSIDRDRQQNPTLVRCWVSLRSTQPTKIYLLLITYYLNYPIAAIIACWLTV